MLDAFEYRAATWALDPVAFFLRLVQVVLQHNV